MEALKSDEARKFKFRSEKDKDSTTKVLLNKLESLRGLPQVHPEAPVEGGVTELWTFSFRGGKPTTARHLSRDVAWDRRAVLQHAQSCTCA